MSRKPTAFDRHLEERRKDPIFEAAFLEARAEIQAIDHIVRQLDAERERRKISKAELARRIGVKPEAIRRLFTTEGANPTMETVIKCAHAIGYKMTLVRIPKVRRSAAPASDTPRRVSASLRSRSTKARSEKASLSR